MLKFAVAFLILASVGGQLIRPLLVYQSLISGVHDYFNNTCILLLHATINPMSTQGLKNAILLRNLQMYFSRDRHIRTAIMDFETFTSKVGQDFFRIKRPLFVILNDAGRIRQLLTNLSSWIKMSYPNWLIFFGNGTRMADFFDAMNIPFDCNFMVSESTGPMEELITESYRVSPKEKLRTLPFGTWDQSAGFRPPKLTFYQRRNDLFGQVLRVTSIENPPMSTIIRNDVGEMKGIGGLFGGIIEILENKMNCKFEFVESRIWGSMMLNGSWNGMMGSITQKKVHLAASEMVITKTRLDAVDFTIPIISSRFHTYIQRPSSLSVKWLSYTAPFNSSIWIAVASLIVVSSIAIVAVESVNFFHERQKQGKRDGKTNGVKNLQLAETMFAIFGAFCGQGMSHTSFEPSRAIHLAVHMTSVILTAAYSAALISFLTIQVFTMPFTTMEGFLEDGTYRFGVVPDSADYTMFTNTTDHVLRALYEERMESERELPRNYLDGLRKVCSDSKYGFMITETMVDALETRVDCILEALDSMLQASLAMVVTKDSAYRGIINNNILLMRDGGIFQRIMKSEWPVKFTKADKFWTSVEISDIAPLAALLACGVILAGLLLLAERFIFQHFERKPIAARMLLPAVIKKT